MRAGGEEEGERDEERKQGGGRMRERGVEGEGEESSEVEWNGIKGGSVQNEEGDEVRA